MQIPSLVVAIIVGIGVGCLNGLIGLNTGYSATSLLFFVILPLGAGLLGIPAGFAAGWFDQSHKGQSTGLLVIWAAVGGAAAIAANYVFLWIGSGAMDVGMGFTDFLALVFDSTEISGRRGRSGFETGEMGRLLGYAELGAAAFGGVIGMGMGMGASRKAAGTSRMPYHFEDIGDVLVAMVGIDGSVDEDEKTIAALGLEISLADWFDDPSDNLRAEIRTHTQAVIEAKTAALNAGEINLDAQLEKLKGQGEQVVNATCVSVFAVAAADDVIDPAEEKMLRDILEKLGQPTDVYEKYLTIGRQLVAAVLPQQDVIEQHEDTPSDAAEDIVEDAQEEIEDAIEDAIEDGEEAVDAAEDIKS